ncbi:MAG TPA: helix-turn-helix domain-containing protein [archaeon]|nr:helix-turn-helix domain-containing protein [archaeon]
MPACGVVTNRYSPAWDSRELCDVLFVLLKGPSSVQGIQKALDEPLSTVSSKLRALARDGIVEKDRWKYSLNDLRVYDAFTSFIANAVTGTLGKKDEEESRQREKRVQSTPILLQARSELYSKGVSEKDYLKGLTSKERRALEKALKESGKETEKVLREEREFVEGFRERFNDVFSDPEVREHLTQFLREEIENGLWGGEGVSLNEVFEKYCSDVMVNWERIHYLANYDSKPLSPRKRRFYDLLVLIQGLLPRFVYSEEGHALNLAIQLNEGLQGNDEEITAFAKDWNAVREKARKVLDGLAENKKQGKIK